MDDRARAVLFSLAIFLVLNWTTVRGRSPLSVPQEPDGRTEKISLKLESAAALPGNVLTVPIYLMVDSDIDVVSLKFDVVFPDTILSFVSSEPGIRELEPIADTFRVELSPSEAEGTALKVDISNETGGRSIPLGPIGLLVFSVQPEAKPGEVDLETKNVVFTTKTGESIVTSQGQRTIVTISDPDTPPVPACFFYMH